MLKVGLTGSIAVGKSFVSDVFRESGVDVLDADLTAREVVAPGTPGLDAIREEFGDSVITANGGLDRAKLGELVFTDEEKRAKLNAIVHPLVIAEQDEWLKEKEREMPGGIAMIDAALMIESGGSDRFDKIIVVWCREEIQLKRLMERNGLSEEDAKRRITTQMSQEEKKGYGDFLIDTSEGFESTREQVIEVLRQLNA
jgi:dephospho-CoA kinase